jgi:hypothetical protein
LTVFSTALNGITSQQKTNLIAIDLVGEAISLVLVVVKLCFSQQTKKWKQFHKSCGMAMPL